MKELKEKYNNYILEQSFVPNQVILRFENDYGMSIVSNRYSYGGLKGLYEIAYIFFVDEDVKNFELVYVQEFEDQVKGYLRLEDVYKYIDKAIKGELE